ncbi:MAG: hypothetical protein BWY26_00280 [Elusimicrobia bacterium ADurb.Bin231]|nr:MAG: hypothetical protein BWY26_00280 [Elusimicrobia bacterium ADurb.Bin231]
MFDKTKKIIASTCYGFTPGFSHVELLIVVMIISVVVLGIVTSFSRISQGIFVSKSQTIANNLAQEKVEMLKSLPYNRLLVTSAYDLANYGYDNTNEEYQSTTLVVSGVQYKRYVTVWKAGETTVGSDVVISTMPPANSDEGLKKIKVKVTWTEHSKTQSIELYNLCEDPNRETKIGRIYGFITSTVPAVIGGALVEVIQNMNWNATTSATGYYIIKTTSPATLQIRATKDGYFPAVSEDIELSYVNLSVGQDLELTGKLTGSVTGWVVLNNHLMVSLVVAALDDGGYEQEYVQLYNPTTWQWTLDDTTMELYYIDEDDNPAKFNLNFANTDLPSYGYYLIANTGTVYVNGSGVTADATFTGNIIANASTGVQAKPGGICLRDGYGVWIDSVSWGHTPAEGKQPPASACEGTGYQISGQKPIEPGKQLYRWHYSDSSYGLAGTIRGGGAYDSNDNLRDFYYDNIPASMSPPYNTGFTSPPLSGTPAEGAIVSANDGLSSPTTAYLKVSAGNKQNAYFSINVATGICTVSLSSGTFNRIIANVNVAAGQTTAIPNTDTSPQWPGTNRNVVILSSPSSGGFISGRVIDATTFNGIPNIKVFSGASTYFTDSAGYYQFAVDVGSHAIIANQNYYSSSWTEEIADALVEINQITNVPDIKLYPAGWISGKTKNASNNPLPFITITSTSPFIYFSKDSFSDSEGNYIIKGVRTGLCFVFPVLDSADSYIAEKSYPVWITQGVENTENNFRIVSSWGKIKGTVKYGSNNITTGVLIIASTATVPTDPPPIIDPAFRTGTEIYYGTVALSDGTYELSVRKGWSYNLRAWFINTNKSGITTISKTGASGTVTDFTSPRTVNFTFP